MHRVPHLARLGNLPGASETQKPMEPILCTSQLWLDGCTQVRQCAGVSVLFEWGSRVPTWLGWETVPVRWITWLCVWVRHLFIRPLCEIPNHLRHNVGGQWCVLWCLPEDGPSLPASGNFHRMTNKETLGPHLARLGDATTPDGHG